MLSTTKTSYPHVERHYPGTFTALQDTMQKMDDMERHIGSYKVGDVQLISITDIDDQLCARLQAVENTLCGKPDLSAAFESEPEEDVGGEPDLSAAFESELEDDIVRDTSPAPTEEVPREVPVKNSHKAKSLEAKVETVAKKVISSENSLCLLMREVPTKKGKTWQFYTKDRKNLKDYKEYQTIDIPTKNGTISLCHPNRDSPTYKSVLESVLKTVTTI